MIQAVNTPPKTKSKKVLNNLETAGISAGAGCVGYLGTKLLTKKNMAELEADIVSLDSKIIKEKTIEAFGNAIKHLKDAEIDKMVEGNINTVTRSLENKKFGNTKLAIACATGAAVLAAGCKALFDQINK